MLASSSVFAVFVYVVFDLTVCIGVVFDLTVCIGVVVLPSIQLNDKEKTRNKMLTRLIW